MIHDSLIPRTLSLFLPGSTGDLYAIYYLPSGSVLDKGDVIYVHPFAEEMNRSRPIIALHARELAKLGFRVLVLTMYGCGDSAGEFLDARWEIWKKDLTIAIQWLHQQDRHRINLWGLRLGALLAVHFASESQGAYERIVLWQPVLSGEKMITQFLRQRLSVHSQIDTQREKETTQDLRRRLMSGELIEVAGYEIAPALVAAIDGLHLATLGSHVKDIGIHWIEIISEIRSSMSPSRRHVVEKWKNAGVKISIYPVVAEPFWILPHRKMNLQLLATMKRIFDQPVI